MVNHTSENKNLKIKEIKEKIIEKKNKRRLFIRFNHFSIYNNSYNIKKGKNKKYKNLIKENDISIYLNNKKDEGVKNNVIISIKNINKSSNNLYINCTKFLVKIFNKIIKKKIFVLICKYSKNL